MDLDNLPSQEPVREMKSARVDTEEQTYKATSVEQYPFWTHIYTSNDQPHTDHEVWVPNVRVKQITPKPEYGW